MNNKERLAHALFDKYHQMRKDEVYDIKIYEFVFQDIIEEIYNDKFWWEVTDCQICTHLFEHNDPEKTIIEIIKQLK